MRTPPSIELLAILARSTAEVPFIPLDLADAAVMLTAAKDENSGVVMTQSRREDGGQGLHQAWFSYQGDDRDDPIVMFKYEGTREVSAAA